MHLDTKRVESTGILRADHARPYHRESFWKQADLKDLVGIMHTGMFEWKFRRTDRR